MDIIKKVFWNSIQAKIQSLLIIVAFVFMVLFIPNFTGQYTPLFVAWTMCYVVMSISWNFFSGKTSYISLATAAFYGLGMYFQAIFGRDIPLWGTMILSAALAFGVGYGIGVVTLRLRGIYFTIFTFGLALFLNKFVHWYEGLFTRTKGRMVKAYSNETVFYAMLIVLAITVIAVLILDKSRFGLSLKCIGQNEDSAQHIGVNTTRKKVLAFAISAAPVGAVGALMSTAMRYVDADIAFNMNASFFPVLMTIFGGMTIIYGPMAGAVVFYLLQDLLIRWTPFYMIIFGGIMVLIVLVMPKGIFGTIESFAAKKRREAERKKVDGDV
ncbi:MAG: branched-chain amino acid ABC transporter permease [Oscillospiraceae bacterium]|jgi:branched-chain amino acid transport system permease protein|nr:branched-chain amino acid ABC transporter permease [Oscillospiraceae bacterium]